MGSGSVSSSVVFIFRLYLAYCERRDKWIELSFIDSLSLKQHFQVQEGAKPLSREVKEKSEHQVTVKE